MNSSPRLTCIYDAFRFGLWAQHPIYRAGVGRVIVALARELAQREDIRLVLLSPAGLEDSIQSYLDRDDALHGAEFLRFEEHWSMSPLGSLARRVKPALVRYANKFLSQSTKTRLKKHLGRGMLAGYHEDRPAMRQVLADFCRQGPTCYFTAYYALPSWLDDVAGLCTCAFVHDIIPLRLPHMHLGDEEYPKRMAGFATRAGHIFTNSAFTKQDFLDYFPAVPASRVSVAHLGCDDRFRPRDAEAVLRVLAKYGIPEGARYIQTLSTLEARKGLEDAVHAFIRCLDENGMEDLYLVLSGQAGWQYEGILSAAGARMDRIIFSGFVDDDDVPCLLSGCLCFAYMSRYEGFGMPILEAMRCGAPVVAANTTSIPEVAGDAGLLLEAGDVQSLASTFARIYSDQDLRQRLSAASIEQARKFSWKSCADTIAEGMSALMDR